MFRLFLTLWGMALALGINGLPCPAQASGGSVGTATVGGTYYIWAGPWAKMVQDSLPGYTLNIEVTGGPVHNIKLLESQEIDFATVSMPAVEDGWKGQGWAKGKTYRGIRTLFPMYPSYATFYAMAGPGIANIRDIEGKIFAPGPKGGTPDAYYRELLKLLSIHPAKIVNAAMNDIPSQIRDGMIDVGAGSGGEPFAPAVELDSTTPIVVLDMDQADMETFVGKYPSWYIGTRPAGGYKLQTREQPTLMYWNLFICHQALSDDIAYSIVDTFFQNLPGFEKVYRDTCKTRPEDVLQSVIPLHPGAVRWYEEHGIRIPPTLIP